MTESHVEAAFAPLELARQKLIPSEHVEQSWLFQEIELRKGKYPELALAFAVPNGSNKSKAQAGMFKAEGLKAGVPDVCFPIPRWPFHGLYIEMKKMGKHAEPGQRQWQAALIGQGYAVFTCQGKDNAIAVLDRYLNWNQWPDEAEGKRASILAELALDNATIHF